MKKFIQLSRYIWNLDNLQWVRLSEIEIEFYCKCEDISEFEGYDDYKNTVADQFFSFLEAHDQIYFPTAFFSANAGFIRKQDEEKKV